MTTKQQIRTTDSKARLSLPKAFANSTVIIETINASEIRIRKAKVIPEGDAEFLEETRQPLSDRDRDLFLALLENPPKPNAALKKAFSKHKARARNA